MSRARLEQARLYACIDARSDHGDLPEFLDAILAGGVDVVQLRDKSLPVAQEMAALELVREKCLAHGALWAVNDRADVAAAVGAPVLHLGQDDLPVAAARQLLGTDVIIGRSTHSLRQASLAAADPDVDYYAVGPVWPTPTKPGRPAVGIGLVGEVAAAPWSATKPWFAIGGIDAQTVGHVVDAGARRVVVVRAVTTAPSPQDAARVLRAAVIAALADRATGEVADAMATDTQGDSTAARTAAAVDA